MILLDTNVISDPQRQSPNARVLDWRRASAGTLYLSVITVVELLACL
jgi:predicted nucleic acid-binding protein